MTRAVKTVVCWLCVQGICALRAFHLCTTPCFVLGEKKKCTHPFTSLSKLKDLAKSPVETNKRGALSFELEICPGNLKIQTPVNANLYETKYIKVNFKSIGPCTFRERLDFFFFLPL